MCSIDLPGTISGGYGYSRASIEGDRDEDDKDRLYQCQPRFRQEWLPVREYESFRDRANDGTGADEGAGAAAYGSSRHETAPTTESISIQDTSVQILSPRMGTVAGRKQGRRDDQ